MSDQQNRSQIAECGKSLSGSLSLRLFLWLFGLVTVAFATYAIVSIRTASAQWNRTVDDNARRFSDVILKSTHYAMLLNQKEHVHHTIRTIGQEPDVEGVRVYDKDGRIIYSADEGEIGEAVDLQAEACVICHDQREPLRSVPAKSRVRVYGAVDQGRILGLITPIVNSPECSAAPCHAHRPDQTVLGVLDVKMSLREADARLALARRQIFVAGALIAMIVGIGSALFIWRGVRRPVRELIQGANRVADGDLSTEIPVRGKTEIGELASAFNRMTGDLSRARGELQNWSRRLENRLVERTAELGRTQRQVVHMEKMASLGKLSATVAHELNNPLAGILNYAKLVQRTLQEGEGSAEHREELTHYLTLVQREAGRCGDIVRNLLVFAKHSGAKMAPASTNAILERTLMLVRHHLEMADVQLETIPLAENDQLVCDANQIQQALVALCVNAVEAMPDGGKLTVRAEGRQDEVEIEIRDTGGGIREQALSQIFEPFFSTKGDQTSGVGLGLAVVYGIVQRHDGEITVDSELGSGTSFRVRLPRNPPAEGTVHDEAPAGMGSTASGA